jgi:REP element-mobilizing transposase RayT
MEDLKKLLPGYFYHIYNRGNNKEDIFIEPENYTYFLLQWRKHIYPVAETFAYALLKNHFHCLVYIRNLPQLCLLEKLNQKAADPSFLSLELSKCFSNLFNGYAKAINKRYHRTGSLFQERFRRKLVMEKAYLAKVILYIHANGQKHGFAAPEEIYPYTSYASLISDKPTRLERDKVFALFGGREAFIKAHQQYQEDLALRTFILENEHDDAD